MTHELSDFQHFVFIFDIPAVMFCEPFFRCTLHNPLTGIYCPNESQVKWSIVFFLLDFNHMSEFYWLDCKRIFLSPIRLTFISPGYCVEMSYALWRGLNSAGYCRSSEKETAGIPFWRSTLAVSQFPHQVSPRALTFNKSNHCLIRRSHSMRSLS